MDIARIRKKGKDTGLAAGQGGGPLPGEAMVREGEEQVLSPSDRGKEVQEGRTSAIQEEKAGETTVELLTFSLEGELFAFRIHEIQEIIKPQKMTRIPRTGPHLIGITSLRGKIIPVIDLKKKMALIGVAENRKQKILVLKGTRGPIGALVDRVIGVIRPQLSEVGETPPHLREAETKFIDGVVLVDEKFVSIVKTEEALSV